MFRNKKNILLKLFSVFSVVRVHNIFLIVLAQYLTSVFILAHEKHFTKVIFDPILLIIVFSTVGVIGSGYIINNFYDQEKDLINRPNKLFIDRIISQKTKLYLYFILNGLVLFLSFIISIRALLFFGGYMFLIWLYSHKIKKLPIIGNITSALLSVTPFFAILLYFKNYNLLIFVFGFYLFLILAIKELIKSIENIKGDFTLNYKTVAVIYGEYSTKWIISVMILINCLVSILLIFYFDISMMFTFFVGASIYLLILLFFVWTAKERKQYTLIHILLKLLILVGVFSIVLLDPELIINKIF